MVVGDFYDYRVQNKFLKIVTSIMGADLHSHIRINPLIQYFKKTNNHDPQILEIGCGSGINAFEIYKYKKDIEYYGFDLDDKAIEIAIEVSKNLACDEKIKFFCEDAVKSKFNINKKFDFILLMDFLEHIEDHENFLRNITHLTHETTIFIVSVPTYNFKKIFGEKIHSNIGHVRDGFNIQELDDIFKTINYNNNFFSYNTGLLSNIGCFFNYRFNFRNKYINFTKEVILSPFRLLDIYNSDKVSCSIFAVFAKGE